MLPNMSCDDFSVLGRSIVENPLDEVVSVLIARNVDERDASSVAATLANSIKIASEKLGTANLETLFDDLGGKLIGTVLGGVANNMVNSSAAIRRSTMLANVLDAPVSELAMSHNVDVRQNLFDAGTLRDVSLYLLHELISRLTLSSSRQFSKMFWTTRLPVSPKATSCHIPRRASLTYFII